MTILNKLRAVLISFIAIASLFFLVVNCSSTESISDEETIDPNGNNEEVAIYADINFSNWKITLPIDANNNGSPDEYQPSQLVNNGYRTLTQVKPFISLGRKTYSFISSSQFKTVKLRSVCCI